MSEGQEEQRKVARLGLIGAGAMGGALLKGLLGAERLKPGELVFCDPDPIRQQELGKLGVEAALDNAEVMHSPVVVLAVKPQILGSVLEEIRDYSRPWQLVISIAAGVPLAVLEEFLPNSRVIRAMPNTPLMVQAGMTALYVTHDQAEAVVLGDRIGVMRDGKLLQMASQIQAETGKELDKMQKELSSESKG